MPRACPTTGSDRGFARSILTRYATSNLNIPTTNQSIDSWIRAVVKHMGTRSFGHGGADTKAVLISIPEFTNNEAFESWLSYTTDKIRKKATPRKRKVKSTQ